MGLIFLFLKKYWLVILIGLTIFYFVERYHGMEKEILIKDAEIASIRGQNEALKSIQADQKKGQVNQDIGAKSQSSVRTKQATTRDKISNVPTTTNDLPFSDPGLLARASILRDHQENSYPSK